MIVWILNSSKINTSKYSSTTPFIQPWEMSIYRLGWSIFLISYCLLSDYMRAFACIKSVCFFNHKNSNYYTKCTRVKLLVEGSPALPELLLWSMALQTESWAVQNKAVQLLGWPYNLLRWTPPLNINTECQQKQPFLTLQLLTRRKDGIITKHCFLQTAPRQGKKKQWIDAQWTTSTL